MIKEFSSAEVRRRFLLAGVLGLATCAGSLVIGFLFPAALPGLASSGYHSSILALEFAPDRLEMHALFHAGENAASPSIMLPGIYADFLFIGLYTFSLFLFGSALRLTTISHRNTLAWLAGIALVADLLENVVLISLLNLMEQAAPAADWFSLLPALVWLKFISISLFCMLAGLQLISMRPYPLLQAGGWLLLVPQIVLSCAGLWEDYRQSFWKEAFAMSVMGSFALLTGICFIFARLYRQSDIREDL